MKDKTIIILYEDGYQPKEKEKKSDIKIKFKTKSMNILGMPKDSTLEYLAESWNGARHDYFLVYSQGPGRDYNTFKLYIGGPNSLKEADVKEVDRLRDGGTTTIRFDFDGRHETLHFPPSFIKDKFPSCTMGGTLVDLLQTYK